MSGKKTESIFNELSNSRLSVAIVGMSCRLPGAESIDEYWNNLLSGTESVRRFSDEELLQFGVSPAKVANAAYIPFGARLAGHDLFASDFFGYSPRESELMDPQHRILLECTWEALENAGYPPQSIKVPTAVFTSTSLSTYLIFNVHPSLQAEQDDEYFQSMIGCDKDFAATRISYKLNLSGPSMAVQTGCSSSLVGVHLAVQSLLTYQCDLAIVGGASIGVQQRTGYQYQVGGILSADGHNRAFDASSSGTIFGEGAGVVVLKRYEDAVTERDGIFAVIRGSAVNNDGRSKIGFTAPSIDGQALVISQALDVAGLEADDISYVEAHGTATELGDPAEVAALTKAFRMTTQRKGFCGLGSVKSSIGHLDAAAGIAGLIKTSLMLKHGMLVRSVNYSSPNPAIEFEESPFYVVSKETEWTGTDLLRAGVSSFGIGGTNAHVVLEQYKECIASPSMRSHEVLCVSAKTEAELTLAREHLCTHLKRMDAEIFPNVGYTLHIGREEFPFRSSLVCTTRSDAIGALSVSDHKRVITGRTEIGKKVTFMFPGGGTQYPGMGRDLYETQYEFRRDIDVCLGLLYRIAGLDIRALLYEGQVPSEIQSVQLRKASIALPSIFITEYAMARMLISRGLRPDYLIGHSLGEYAAACLAGIFSLEDAISLVVTRGRLLERLPAGAMLSIDLPETELKRIMGSDLSLAAVNAPNQCVVSGPVHLIERMASSLAEKGVDSSRLHLDIAAHSSLVDPILEEFGMLLKSLTLRRPMMPMMSNLTGEWITDEDAQSPQYWMKQLRETVRFSDGVTTLNHANSFFVEVGPSNTLSSLVRLAERTDRICSSMKHPRDDKADSEIFYSVFAKAWTSGVAVDWDAFYEGETRHRVSLPTYPFTRKRFWIEPRSSRNSSIREQERAEEKEAKVYVQTWEQCSLPGEIQRDRKCPAGVWLVFTDEPAVVRRLREICDARQIHVICVEKGNGFIRYDEMNYKIRPEVSDDYELLFSLVQSSTPGDVSLIHMWSPHTTLETMDNVASYNERLSNGAFSLLCLFGVLARPSSMLLKRCLIVTSGVAQISNSDAICPENAMLLPLCTVAMQEDPKLFCKVIDVEGTNINGKQAKQIANALCAEIVAADLEPVVALRGFARYIRRFQSLELNPRTEFYSYPRRSIYVIVGGLGRLGLLLAEFLAVRERCTIVLTSRANFAIEDPQEWFSQKLESRSRSVAETIRRIEDAGSAAIIETLDASKEQEVKLFFTKIATQYGGAKGIFHLAGFTGSEGLSLIQDLSKEKCELQFAPKVLGTRSLQSALADHDFEFCILFSSTASLLGGVGLAAYAMANSYLDVSSNQSCVAMGKRWISINWDAWLRTGSSQAIDLGSTSLDTYAINENEALSIVVRAIGSSVAGPMFVSRRDPHRRVQDLMLRPEEASLIRSRPSISTDFAKPMSEIEVQIATIWRDVLGIERIGIDDSFFELGGNSLIALRIISRMQKQVSTDVSVLSIFESPTIRGLAQKTIAAAPTRANMGFERGKARRARLAVKKESAISN